jgi:hypothetical protein
MSQELIKEVCRVLRKAPLPERAEISRRLVEQADVAFQEMAKEMGDEAANLDIGDTARQIAADLVRNGESTLSIDTDGSQHRYDGQVDLFTSLEKTWSRFNVTLEHREIDDQQGIFIRFTMSSTQTTSGSGS